MVPHLRPLSAATLDCKLHIRKGAFCNSRFEHTRANYEASELSKAVPLSLAGARHSVRNAQGCEAGDQTMGETR